MDSLEIVQADFEQEYKYSFQLNFTPETVILLSCSLQEDCTQWIRILSLITQMNRLAIDFRIVNPFSFEHHKEM